MGRHSANGAEIDGVRRRAGRPSMALEAWQALEISARKTVRRPYGQPRSLYECEFVAAGYESR